MPELTPPDDDREITRHKFYVAITSALDNNTKAMLAIGAKLDIIVAEHNAVAEEFNKLQSSIKTTLRIATLLISLFGGTAAFMLSKTYQYTDRLETVERTVAIREIKDAPLDKLPDAVEELKDRVKIIEEHEKIEKGYQKR